jgi:hypothetical protein
MSLYLPEAHSFMTNSFNSFKRFPPFFQIIQKKPGAAGHGIKLPDLAAAGVAKGAIANAIFATFITFSSHQTLPPWLNPNKVNAVLKQAYAAREYYPYPAIFTAQKLAHVNYKFAETAVHWLILLVVIVVFPIPGRSPRQIIDGITHWITSFRTRE